MQHQLLCWLFPPHQKLLLIGGDEPEGLLFFTKLPKQQTSVAICPPNHRPPLIPPMGTTRDGRDFLSSPIHWQLWHQYETKAIEKKGGTGGDELGEQGSCNAITHGNVNAGFPGAVQVLVSFLPMFREREDNAKNATKKVLVTKKNTFFTKSTSSKDNSLPKPFHHHVPSCNAGSSVSHPLCWNEHPVPFSLARLLFRRPLEDTLICLKSLQHIPWFLVSVRFFLLDSH